MGISSSIAAGLGALGIGGETAGALAPILAGVGEGALGGGAISGLTGGNVGKGALGGAITGGFIPAGGELLSGSLGTVAGDALGGVAGGSLGSLATGGNPLTGALEGGISGGVAGALSPGNTGASSGSVGAVSSAAPSSGGAAGATAAPASVAGGSPDVSFPSQPTNAITGSFDQTLAANADNLGAPSAASTMPSGQSAVANPNPTSTAAAPNQTTPTIGNPTSNQNPLNQILAGGQSTAPNGNINTFSTAPQTPTAPAGNSIANLFNGTGSIGQVLAANSNLALPAVGLAADAIKGNQELKGQRQLQQIASEEQGQGQQLENYLQSGTLPPGVQASINQAADAAKAQIQSRAAQMGGSGSSATQQQLAAVDEWAAGQGAQTAMGLLQQGIQQSNLAGSLFADIANQSAQQDAQLQSAFGSLAAAASGQPQINLGGLNKLFSGTSGT